MITICGEEKHTQEEYIHFKCNHSHPLILKYSFPNLIFERRRWISKTTSSFFSKTHWICHRLNQYHTDKPSKYQKYSEGSPNNSFKDALLFSSKYSTIKPINLY